MEKGLDPNSTTQWQDVGDILHAFNSISRFSKGNSSNQIFEESKSNTSSPSGSGMCSSSSGGQVDKLMRNPSSQERYVGMGRGKLIQKLEKKFEGTPEQLDMNIHSELSQIGCGYSNEAIEHNWGYSFSSSECSAIEISSTSDDDNQAPIEPEPIEKNLLIEELAQSVANVTLENTPEPPPPAEGECNTEQPSAKDSSKSPSIRNNRSRKCRNFIVLNSLTERPPPNPALQGSKSSPQNKHSYSGVLGSKKSASVGTEGNSIFSDKDFPAL